MSHPMYKYDIFDTTGERELSVYVYIYITPIVLLEEDGRGHRDIAGLSHTRDSQGRSDLYRICMLYDSSQLVMKNDIYIYTNWIGWCNDRVLCFGRYRTQRDIRCDCASMYIYI
jgi:hypothetical protein